jgi:hypothetical protein
MDISLRIAVFVSSVSTLALVCWLERKLPYRKQFNKSHGDSGRDVASASVLIAVVDPLIKAIAPSALVALYAAVGNALLIWNHVIGTFKSATGLVATKTIGFLTLGINEHAI